jgi:hypothetical protein
MFYADNVRGRDAAGQPPRPHHLTGDLVPEQMAGVSANYGRRGMTLVPRTKG